MRQIVVFIAVLCLLACVEKARYDKHGAGLEQIHYDQSACEEKAEKAIKDGDKRAQRDIELECMQVLGYHPINYFIR